MRARLEHSASLVVSVSLDPHGRDRSRGQRPCAVADRSSRGSSSCWRRSRRPRARARPTSRPATSITAADAERVKDLVSPGMFWCVQHGCPMRSSRRKSVPAAPRLHRGDREVLGAGEARRRRPHGSRTTSPGGRSRSIDTTDPRSAMKIMQNFSMRVAIDDLDLRNFDADTGPISTDAPAAGRAPLPDRPLPPPVLRRPALRRSEARRSPTPEGFEYKETLHPLIEPFDLKGVGFTYYRYLDPAQAGRQLALPAVAASRAPALDRAALRRALRPGHRLRTATAATPGRSRGWTGSSSARRTVLAAVPHRPLPGEVGRRRRRLGVRRRVGEARRLRRRGRVEAPAVRLLEARALRRQGDLRDPVQRHVRPRRPALEDLDQQLRSAKEAFPGATIKYDEDTPFAAGRS